MFKKLYTIGYEGLNIEQYIKKLIENDIRAVVDVRRNAFSYKSNFSKDELNSCLLQRNILYYHIPELGIDSNKRKNVKLTIEPEITLFGEEKSQLQILFEEYKRILPTKQKHIELLLNIINKYQNVALTCFEHDYKCCHRHIIAEYIKNEVNIIKHL